MDLIGPAHLIRGSVSSSDTCDASGERHQGDCVNAQDLKAKHEMPNSIYKI